MRIVIHKRVVFILAISFFLKAHANQNNSLTSFSEIWPYSFNQHEQSVTFYPPQISLFEGNRLDLIIAAAATVNQSTVYGRVEVECRVDINRDTNKMRCEQAKLINLDFPIGTDKQQLEQLITQAWEMQPIQLTLTQLQSSLAFSKINQLRNKNIQLKHTPPLIYIAREPTVLVLIDGQAQFQKIENTEVMRVINTAFTLLFDLQTNTYYLQAGDRWMQASALMGPWTLIHKLPNSIKSLEIDPMRYANQPQTFKQIPKIIVSSQAAELIQFNGPPGFSPINGTHFLYANNSSHVVLFQIGKQAFYVLISGRWYTSAHLASDAKWSYCPPSELPDDIAQIPINSPVSAILASTPSTLIAKEGILNYQIPQTAKVSRKFTSLNIQYDGNPQFLSIPDTPLRYAINTKYSVILFENAYYVCYQGIWFVSRTPIGPWEVATEVPDDIYLIPPSSPLYPVTHVYVYDYDPSVVYVGYTPGYLGSYMVDGVMVYGTGYSYKPWLTTQNYYGHPITFGFNFTYDWTRRSWSARVLYNTPGWYGWGLKLSPLVDKVPLGWHIGWFEAANSQLFINPSQFQQFAFYGNKATDYDTNQNIYRRWDSTVVLNAWNQTVSNEFAESNFEVSNHVLILPDELNVKKDITNKDTGILPVQTKPLENSIEGDLYSGLHGGVYQYQPAQGWLVYNSEKQWQPVNNPSLASQLDAERVQRIRGFKLQPVISAH